MYRDLWPWLYNKTSCYLHLVPTQLQQVSWEFRGEGVATESWGGWKGAVVVGTWGKAGRYVSISGYNAAQMCPAQL